MTVFYAKNSMLYRFQSIELVPITVISQSFEFIIVFLQFKNKTILFSWSAVRSVRLAIGHSFWRISRFTWKLSDETKVSVWINDTPQRELFDRYSCMSKHRKKVIVLSCTIWMNTKVIRYTSDKEPES
jgi:hypothetical protein